MQATHAAWLVILFQSPVQKREHACLRVHRRFRTKALSRVRVFETVSGAGVDFHIYALVFALHDLLEHVYILSIDAAILGSEISENRRADGFDVCLVSGHGTVVDNTRGQFWFFDGKLERQTAPHAPADRADLSLIHVDPGGEVVESCP